MNLLPFCAHIPAVYRHEEEISLPAIAVARHSPNNLLSSLLSFAPRTIFLKRFLKGITGAGDDDDETT